MTLTLTDFFCGAGGSSTGAIAVPGVEVKVAANHWALAVEVHNANHQDAMHVQADISEYDPRLIPRTDIAWLSPSCTNHSIAQGKSRREIDAAPDLFGEVLPDAAAERSRSTMWDVVRYSEYHRCGRGSELNPGYWADSVKYLEAEERKASMPSLFDLVTDEQVPA